LLDLLFPHANMERRGSEAKPVSWFQAPVQRASSLSVRVARTFDANTRRTVGNAVQYQTNFLAIHVDPDPGGKMVLTGFGAAQRLEDGGHMGGRESASGACEFDEPPPENPFDQRLMIGAEAGAIKADPRPARLVEPLRDNSFHASRTWPRIQFRTVRIESAVRLSTAAAPGWNSDSRRGRSRSRIRFRRNRGSPLVGSSLQSRFRRTAAARSS
jgi:hypothetical protein